MKSDVEQFEEFSEGVKRGLKDGIKPDPAGYTQLVERVRAVNEEAATYMNFQAPALASFQQSSKLPHAFAWDSTPQGQDFWLDIFLAIDGAQ